jgi:hypothetical protein
MISKKYYLNKKKSKMNIKNLKMITIIYLDLILGIFLTIK